MTTTTETETTPAQAAAEIVSQMSPQDRDAFSPDDWRDSVAEILTDDWHHLDTDDVLAAIEDAAALHPEQHEDGWRVLDTEGGVWYPDASAAAEIATHANPGSRALEICAGSPMRGTWRS